MTRHKEKIVIIIGLPRSGTTMLGNLFSKSEKCAYIEEPNVIWRYRNFRKYRHDEYLERDATQNVSKYIRDWFSKRTTDAGSRILIEKTPANVLRVDFVNKVFPSAEFLFLERSKAEIRDSIFRRIELGEDKNAFHMNDRRKFRFARIRARRFLKTPLRDKMAYLPTAICAASSGRFYPNERFWGPRPESWQTLCELPLEEMITQHVDYMSMHFANSLERYRNKSLSVSYRDLTFNPARVLPIIEEFVGLQIGSLPNDVPISPQSRPRA